MWINRSEVKGVNTQQTFTFNTYECNTRNVHTHCSHASWLMTLFCVGNGDQSAVSMNRWIVRGILYNPANAICFAFDEGLR